MGFKDHRRKAEGKKIRVRRMPAPSECKLGTQVHETERYDLDDGEMDVEKCTGCGKFEPFDELDKEGLCFTCREDTEDIVEEEG